MVLVLGHKKGHPPAAPFGALYPFGHRRIQHAGQMTIFVEYDL